MTLKPTVNGRAPAVEPDWDAGRQYTVVTEEARLREILGEPSEFIRAKISDRLNELTRRFVDLSPFVLLATSEPGGTCDVTPRGDQAGFVRVLDEQTLLLPERPGNRLAESMRNILQNGHVGLLFVIPGVGDTLRVNGRATIIADEELLAASAVEGKAPRIGLLIEVDEVFTHCPKAFLRSELWNPSRYVDRGALPSSGEIHSRRDPSIDAESYDKSRAERYARREDFY